MNSKSWSIGTLAILTVTLVYFALLGLFTLFGVILGIGDNYEDMPLDDLNTHVPSDIIADCISWVDGQLGDCETVSMIEMRFVMTIVLIITYLGLQGLITWYFIKKHNTRVRANNSNISPN